MKRAAVLLAALLLLPAAAPATHALRIVSVDVEGGAAVLMMTPQGRSLLIDTGWAPGQGQPPTSSADRIVAAAKSLGIRRIDYLVMTHYHADHLGGLESLLARMPVDTFVDHGPNRESLRPGATPAQIANAPATRYPAWAAAWRGHRHLSMKAGETLDVGSLHLLFVASDGAIVPPLPGAGRPNPACAGVGPSTRFSGAENDRSLGMLMTFGKTRLLDLGDLTWNKELELFCPANRIGPVDVLFVTGHGMALSSSPPTAALAPVVAVMQNGRLKGGDAEVIHTVEGYPGLQGFWRQHYSARFAELNGDPHTIANLDWLPDQGYTITLDITHDGAITVTNGRNGFSRSYRARTGD